MSKNLETAEKKFKIQYKNTKFKQSFLVAFLLAVPAE